MYVLLAARLVSKTVNEISSSRRSVLLLNVCVFCPVKETPADAMHFEIAHVNLQVLDKALNFPVGNEMTSVVKVWWH